MAKTPTQTEGPRGLHRPRRPSQPAYKQIRKPILFTKARAHKTRRNELPRKSKHRKPPE
jgi:hypothetical protein